MSFKKLDSNNLVLNYIKKSGKDLLMYIVNLKSRVMALYNDNRNVRSNNNKSYPEKIVNYDEMFILVVANDIENKHDRIIHIDKIEIKNDICQFFSVYNPYHADNAKTIDDVTYQDNI